MTANDGTATESIYSKPARIAMAIGWPPEKPRLDEAELVGAIEEAFEREALASFTCLWTVPDPDCVRRIAVLEFGRGGELWIDRPETLCEMAVQADLHGDHDDVFYRIWRGEKVAVGDAR